jgi:putative transposase
MPRQPRYTLADIPQHVIQRGNNRQATFFTDTDYRTYLDCLTEACSKHDCQVHAYVLMTNHVHLLMTPSRPDGISKAMQSLGRRYVRYVNDVYGRTGTLWEGRYKASLIDSEQYLLTCYRYIELNPVRANMVRHPGEYRWSSYAHHAGDRVDPLLKDHAEYLALGQSDAERQAAYRELFRAHVDDSLISTIRATTNQCLVLGSERFKDEIEQALSRSVRHGKVGRPKKEIAV